jgi:hypothetical protein
LDGTGKIVKRQYMLRLGRCGATAYQALSTRLYGGFSGMKCGLLANTSAPRSYIEAEMPGYRLYSSRKSHTFQKSHAFQRSVEAEPSTLKRGRVRICGNWAGI